MNEYSEQTTLGANANTTDTVTTGLDVRENTIVAWSVNEKTGDHSNHIFTLQCSTDNSNWTDTASTLTTAGDAYKIEDNISIAARYVRAKCTTAEGNASTVDIIINAK